MLEVIGPLIAEALRSHEQPVGLQTLDDLGEHDGRRARVEVAERPVPDDDVVAGCWEGVARRVALEVADVGLGVVPAGVVDGRWVDVDGIDSRCPFCQKSLRQEAIPAADVKDGVTGADGLGAEEGAGIDRPAPSSSSKPSRNQPIRWLKKWGGSDESSHARRNRLR
jgi:hypothetical protein